MDFQLSAFSFQRKPSGIRHRVPGSRQPIAADCRPASGFTLMEILLVILILGIVVTTVLASFNAVFSTTATLDKSAKYYDMAKNSMNRIMLDLEDLYVSQPPFYKPPQFDEPPDPYRIVGAQNEAGGISFAILRFTSRAHIPLEGSIRDGIAEIVYYVKTKNDGQRVLQRGDHLYPYPPFEENAADPVLCEDVKSLAFKYFNEEGSESEEWDSDSEQYEHATPTAIAVQLELGDETRSYTFKTTVRLPVFRKKNG